ncbi:Carbonic anhydrase [Sporotomaculum syntrophicum]|uniref:Carbonic anhydrase n=1 Tax=Sporotomaculum syntrophicum TaxID=182264 RepID=A0A9D3AYP7_9FIRM|nr:carbonic anhydrase [Sporotomaculum syntrophicum]KAF1085676.1 Carbonic anhydrase [Sporotomaculum syntrophicum]
MPNADTSGKFYERPETIASGDEAKQLLIDGNKRFMQAKQANLDLGSTKRTALLKGQKPFAAILSCSDSRVPPELIFDQGLGDLFIIRNAGNIIDPVSLGSIEYAIEHLQVPLLVVMGHQNCGAVTATVEGGEATGSISAIVKRIAPAVEKAKAGKNMSKEELIEKSIKENIKATIRIIERSPILEHVLANGKLTIVGAEYHLVSGEVQWLNY